MAASQTLTAYHLRVAELKIAKTCARQKIHALPMQFVLQGITEEYASVNQATLEIRMELLALLVRVFSTYFK